MKKFTDEQTNKKLSMFNSFSNGDALMIMVSSSDEYTHFKKIFAVSRNIIPIQIICENHKNPNVDYMIGINIYDAIPIYYLETTWEDKPEDKMIKEECDGNFIDISTWIDTKSSKNLDDINKIITKMLLGDRYGTFAHYGDQYKKNYVSKALYSKNNDEFIGQYIANHINGLRIENNITLRVHTQRFFPATRATNCNVFHLSKKIRQLLTNNVKFRYERCADVIGCYYDFPLPTNFSKNIPLVRHFCDLANDDGWIRQTEIKIYSGFINVDFGR